MVKGYEPGNRQIAEQTVRPIACPPRINGTSLFTIIICILSLGPKAINPHTTHL
jgi:hypothetical protein